jgi:pyruvate/2-oxoglutarate dehydrogenase complex dihydrolipoamide acyltransferase (E2) component
MGTAALCSRRPITGRGFAAMLAFVAATVLVACSRPESVPAAPEKDKAAARPSRPEDAEAAALRRRVEHLRTERDAAAGRVFYLRLDARRNRLVLMLQGVVLDDYATGSLEWGVPQVLFVDRRPAPGWDVGSFSKGRLEPARERDRLEVVAPAPAPSASAAEPAPAASPSAPPVPKSAEEAYSVPSPYRIVFAEGVSLEVRSKGGTRNRSVTQRAADAARLRLADLASALGLGRTKERVRLRVTLEADDAASLYRSLPPDVGLFVVGLPAR